MLLLRAGLSDLACCNVKTFLSLSFTLISGTVLIENLSLTMCSANHL